MADENEEGPEVTEDALPMQAASPVAYVVGLAALLLVGGLVVFAMSEGESSQEEAPPSDAVVDTSANMSKAELEERRAHLRKTQAALIAAAADDAEEHEEERQAEQQRQASPKSSTAERAAPKPKPKPKPVNTKEASQSLDALGADITSALE